MTPKEIAAMADIEKKFAEIEADLKNIRQIVDTHDRQLHQLEHATKQIEKQLGALSVLSWPLLTHV
jgi:hypothetical protein